MLHAKFRGNRPAGSEEEDFLKGFYHIWAWWSSWSCDQHHVIGPPVLEKKIFEGFLSYMGAANTLSFPLPK